MKKHISVLCTFFLLLISCKHQSATVVLEMEEVQAAMQNISERNRSYKPLTQRDETLMQHVVSYYQEHGTSNDLMVA